MGTRDEAVEFIKQICGYRKSGDATIIKMMERAQLELQRGPTFPWFLLSERSQILTTVSDERIPLPANFIGEYEEDGIWLRVDTTDPEQDIILEKDDVDLLRNLYKNTTGQPLAYSKDGTYFRLFPTPDEQYQLRMMYYRKAESLLGANIENEWLKHSPNSVIGKAGGWYAATLRDKGAMQVFDKLETEARLVLENENESRKHTNRRYQIGGPE